MARPYVHLNDDELVALYDRDDPLAIQEMAERYRLNQAERMLADFETAHGRPPTSIQELRDFAAVHYPPGHKIKPEEKAPQNPGPKGTRVR